MAQPVTKPSPFYEAEKEKEMKGDRGQQPGAGTPSGRLRPRRGRRAPCLPPAPRPERTGGGGPLDLTARPAGLVRPRPPRHPQTRGTRCSPERSARGGGGTGRGDFGDRGGGGAAGSSWQPCGAMRSARVCGGGVPGVQLSPRGRGCGGEPRGAGPGPGQGAQGLRLLGRVGEGQPRAPPRPLAGPRLRAARGYPMPL